MCRLFETRKGKTGFYVSRQAVSEGRSSEGGASFKQLKPWLWHVEFILGVSVVGLVRDRQTDRKTDRQTETDRQTQRGRETETDTDRQTDRQRQTETGIYPGCLLLYYGFP